MDTRATFVSPQRAGWFHSTDMRTVWALCCALLAATLGTAQEQWGYYDSTVPPWLWGSRFPTCDGRRQSPLALGKAVSRYNYQRSLKWNNYHLAPVSMELENTGESVKLTGRWKDEAATPHILSAGSKYVFDSLHFHWGSDNSRGSEHTNNGVRYPLEMHMVHRKEDGPGEDILVAGVWFKVSRVNTRASNMQRLVRNLGSVAAAHTKADVKPFVLVGLVPQDFSRHFYEYLGSLTTPPCNETVHWVLSDTPSGVTNEQLHAFRSLRDSEGKALQNNFRPLQSRNGRSINHVVPR